MIHLTARKTHYHYTHKTNAARFASSACTLARRCSASNEQLLSAHSSSTDQSPRTHDARHRRIHMAKLRTGSKKKKNVFLSSWGSQIVHWFTWWNYQKPQGIKNEQYRRNQKKLTRRWRWYKQMWPVAAEFWVYQKSKLSAIESLSQQLIFTFQGMLMQSWRLPWFHISQKCRFFCGVPHRKKRSSPVYQRFSPLFWKAYMQESNAIIDLPAFLGMSTRATTVSEWWFTSISAPCVPPTNDKPGIMDPLKTHLCGMWDLKPSIHGECVIPFLHSKVILFPDCFSHGDLREEVGRV